MTSYRLVVTIALSRFGFRVIDDVSFSASMTFWPLLMATRPVSLIFNMKFLLVFYTKCSILTTALQRTVFLARGMGQMDIQTDDQQLRLMITTL